MATKNMADKELAPTFFVLKFLGVFLLLSWLLDQKPIADLLIGFFVLVMKCFILLLGRGTVNIVNNHIVVNSISMIIAKECTGVAMYSLFLAFAAAYGISRNTWKYAVFGLLMLVGLNVMRLFTITLSTFFGVRIFNFVHDLLWPSTFFVFTLIAALFYIRRSPK